MPAKIHIDEKALRDYLAEQAAKRNQNYLSRTQYNEDPKRPYTATRLEIEYRTWNKVIEMAGLVPTPTAACVEARKYSKEELYEVLYLVDQEVNGGKIYPKDLRQYDISMGPFRRLNIKLNNPDDRNKARAMFGKRLASGEENHNPVS